MVQFSNKPNLRGLRNVVEDIKYSSQLMGREQRVFSGLIATRIYGMSIGFILALVLVGIPIAYKLTVGA